MKTLLTFYEKYKNICYFTVGFALSVLLVLPLFLLGTGSIVTYHDQLDGELLNYILAAKYLFTDIRVYPEIMNGLPAAGAVPPAPLFVLPYVFLKPFAVFALTQLVIYIIAFFGMYLLLLKLTGRAFISFGIAVIFMLLPFYPVYGLCIPGQPLLFYAVLSLHGQEMLRDGPPARRRRRAFLYYALAALYAAASSPVLVGFACLLALSLFALSQSIAARRAGTKIPLSPWLTCVVLLTTYIACNPALAKQVLFPGSTYVSHKAELALSPTEPLPRFMEVLKSGVDYAKSYHTVLFFLSGLCLLVFLSKYMRTRFARRSFSSVDIVPQNRKTDLSFAAKISSDSERLFLGAMETLFFIFVICLFSAFYRGNFMTEIRNASTGLLKTFNLDRVCWLLPTAWCIFGAYLLSYIACLAEHGEGTQSSREDFSDLSAARDVCCDSGNFRSNKKRILAQGIILSTLGIWGVAVLLHSSLRPNISKLLKGGDYYALDWDRFFAEDIFSQIEDAIGAPKEDYRVVSVGIYPAAAAYNGFCCLDGYSNNYPLAYKHAFRRIIEGELSKNEYVRALFDTWGNRCYITTAEQANYYTFEKKWGSVIYDLDLNTDALKELNCRYLFSAAYLMNAEEKGLTLLREAPFETENSWYHIYVYEIH